MTLEGERTTQGKKFGGNSHHDRSRHSWTHTSLLGSSRDAYGYLKEREPSLATTQPAYQQRGYSRGGTSLDADTTQTQNIFVGRLFFVLTTDNMKVWDYYLSKTKKNTMPTLVGA